MDAQLSVLPSDADIDALNVTLPPELILQAAVATADEYRPSVESAEEPLQAVNDSMVHAEGAVAAHMAHLVGGDLLVWLPAAVALAYLVAALHRAHGGVLRDLSDAEGELDGTLVRDEGKYAEEERKRRALCWLHASFYCGLAFAALVAAPGFAVLSVGALPLSDVCEIIPATNGSASALLRVFEIPGLSAGVPSPPDPNPNPEPSSRIPQPLCLAPKTIQWFHLAVRNHEENEENPENPQFG